MPMCVGFLQYACPRAVRLAHDPPTKHTGAAFSRVLLADAISAERIAAAEATGLRAELDRRREWKVLRRLRWALRGERR
jgi:hypothetical protein